MDRIVEEPVENKSEARILQLLREQGESSIAELSRISGLGKATASRAIQSLRMRGLVEDTGDEFRRLASGRPGRAVRIRPDVGLYLGISLSAGGVTAVVADAAKRVVAWERQQADSLDGTVPRATSLADFAERMLERAGCDRKRLYGVGVSVAGPVDPRTGEVGNSVIIPQWTGSRPHEDLSAHFGKPVLLDNDANCSALAELLWGELNCNTTAVFLRLDQGIGGAIVHNGEVLHGRTGRAGDYGHVTYDPNGPECRCGGYGCFERYLSISSVESDLSATLAEIQVRTRSGDAAALEIVRHKGQILGSLAAVVSRTVDPDRILIGGGLLALGPGLLDAANERLHAINRTASKIETASAATVLEDGSLHDEPALGAIGLLIRQERSIA
ncbi:ROK family transcriptional regulator [Rhizobium sp. SL86]|uniref:ROK family transcriptional regulator n=1 Tax=Rhizobium sp. SL86 TaxID=2995148 RepID=UPI00227666F3|nr:ROK family transcriptional regulator [Rhizobium sp. SL86]MCY1667639.1 ROK family transcriptional regulator [Rhizobium sp. SL86]